MSIRNIHADIQADGGITGENAWEFLDAGANILVAGTSVFHGNVAKNTQEFIRIIKK